MIQTAMEFSVIQNARLLKLPDRPTDRIMTLNVASNKVREKDKMVLVTKDSK